METLRAPYSYKSDPNVPVFDDSGPVTVMDAHCALCARGAKWIAKNDTAKEFKIIPLQSDLGNALMQHYEMDPNDPTSWLYITDGVAYTSLDALIKVGARLGGVWNLLSILRILPSFIQDYLYRKVAMNRYRLFGKADLCSLPDPDVRERLLS
ncbi:MAG: DCC1-like thiol-disulfide oxidoreductase family protein [Rhizobiaceae bacterium]|nr:DCC1-like thiol-disulfide oxidoreductase family protein [Rhizobiaceae bacterium]